MGFPEIFAILRGKAVFFQKLKISKIGSFTMAAKFLYGMDMRSIAVYDTVHIDVLQW